VKRKCRPSGRKSGNPGMPTGAGAVTELSVPPLAEMNASGATGRGENRIRLSRLHAPPRGSVTRARTVGDPPLIATVFN
jgi:hypothetical protein